MGTLTELRQTVDVLMRANHETQAGLGMALRLSQAQISRKQAGSSAWTLNDCDKIAQHYGVTVAQLLSGRPAALEAAWPTIRASLLATGADYEGLEDMTAQDWLEP